MPENTLPYPINDADNHFNEPDDCFERYIDPSKIDLAIRSVRIARGQADAAVRGPAVEVPQRPGDVLEG